MFVAARMIQPGCDAVNGPINPNDAQSIHPRPEWHAQMFLRLLISSIKHSNARLGFESLH